MKELDTYLEKYKKWGLCPLPLGKNKKPPIKWAELQERKATVGEVKQWREKYWSNGYNIGIVCGRTSGNLSILDIDDPEIADAFKREFEAKLGVERLEDITPVERTPRGGLHIWLLTDELIHKQDFEGVEVKGQGAYAMVPPSTRADGTAYKFLNPDVPSIFLLEDAQAVLVLKPKKAEKTEAPQKEDNWITEALAKGARHGERDDICTRLAGYLLNTHPPDIAKVMLYSFAEKCEQVDREGKSDPFTNRDVDKVIDSFSNTIGVSLSVYTKGESDDLSLERTKPAQKTHNFGIEDVREFVYGQGYRYWEVRSLDYELGINLPAERHYRRRLCDLMEIKGEIEKHPTQGSKYRRIDQADIIDYKTVQAHEPVDLWLPFRIHERMYVYPGNLLDFAGITDIGKTTVSINIIENNDGKWQIDYFTNELVAGELYNRLKDIAPTKRIEDWNFTARNMTPGYLGRIRPDILTIFDYIDVGDPWYRIAEEQQEIHKAIGNGVAIIFLQKDEASQVGRGRGFSTQLPRLYVVMNPGTVYIYKAKTPKPPDRPFKGYTCDFWLTDSGTTINHSEWRKTK